MQFKSLFLFNIRAFSRKHLRIVKSSASTFNGFTLIEVMITICIIGTLAAIAIPNYIGYRDKANNARAISDIKNLELAIQNFYVTTGQYPDSLDQVASPVPKDPWGTPYQYLRIDGGSAPPGHRRKDHAMVPVNTDFDLYSMGKDMDTTAPFTASNSQDDIVRANNGGFVGLVSDF
jgi:general secretion pathway protein G